MKPTRKPLARKTGLRKKAAKKRRVAATCSVLRCKRRPLTTASLCLTHATREADRLVGNYVKARDGGCVASGVHNGGLQWAHIVSRRYRGVRWDPAAAVTLCAGHHTYYTMRPLEWEAWVDERLGEEAHRDLKHRALAFDGRVNVADVIAAYRGRAA